MRDKNKVLEEEVFTLKRDLLRKESDYKKQMSVLENKLSLI